MKKSRIFAILMLICFTLVFMAACANDLQRGNDNPDPSQQQNDNTDKDAPTAFLHTVENSNSATIEYSMDMQGITMSFTMKVDGDKAYHSGMMDISETYVEKLDDKFYIYTKTGDAWTKEETDIDEYNELFGEVDFSNDELFSNFFDSDNLEYDEETERYNFKELFEIDEIELSAAYLTIKDEVITIYFEMETSSAGMTFLVKNTMVIKDINKTTIVLPEVAGENI